jgi:S1-C subfamily serine protease
MKKTILIVVFNLGVTIAQEKNPINQPSTNLSIIEQVAYSTIRIEVSNGKESGIGTGFFFRFLEKDGLNIPAIVTNKHVIRGMSKGTFLFTSANEDGTPNNLIHIPVNIDEFEKAWIFHPDPKVDLAIMPIQPLLDQIVLKHLKPFFISLDKNLVPADDKLKELSAVEDILMVGYPIGLWDAINNYPLFRKGITSSHPANDYNGRTEFLIDAACFPGSSGSPVFLSNIGNYVDKRGATNIATRFYFLGVLYAGPQYSAKGEIVVVDVPTKKDTSVVSNIPTNLGYVIKSKRLLEFDSVLEKIVNKK